jgi:Tfp pilus assembly protein PilV
LLFKEKTMMTRRLPAIRLMCVLLALLGLAIAALAVARYTVTANIYNHDSNNNAFTLQSDGTASAVYSTGSGVASEITPNAGAGGLYQWFLNLTNSSRSFYLTLTPLNGSSAVFSGALPFNGQLFSRCFTSNGGYQNWTQIQYSDSNCAMRANFTYSGTGYSLVMSPTETGTGTATVTCTNWSTSSKSCSAWTDVPTAGIANANVANLYNGANLAGQYFLSFNIALTHP